MRKYLYLFFSSFLAISAHAQDSLWTLQESVQYALAHNIDLQESVLNERLSKLELQQSRLSQIPNASLSANYGKSFGRSVDPTSNQFINSNYDFVGLSGNTDVLLFGWFQKRNNIKHDQLSLKAAQADYAQLQDDISLNVATAFLRILLAREQVEIAGNQLKFSNKQKNQTEAFVDAGRSPELDLAQMESQVATDSSTYFSAVADYQKSILDMKALMNLDIAAPFFAVEPVVNNITYTEIYTNSPEQIYNVAKNHFGAIKSSAYKVEAAKKNVAAKKGALYPQLGLGAQFGTNYSSTLREISNVKVTGAEPTGNFVNVNGTPYLVMQPTVDFSSSVTPLGKQLNNNFRQTVALNLTVPLFNGWTTRTTVAQAKIDVEHNQLEEERARTKLKQDVFSAYYDAKSAIKKYYAAQKAAEASGRALDFAQKRYALGLMNAVELLTTQNTDFKARSDAASAKYDMIFKLKVIDYYLGKRLKL